MSRSIETLYRQWQMLAKVPRYPRKVSTRELKNTLTDNGYEIDIRTIQRDLDKLSNYFPLNFETRGRKNYWFLIENVPVLEIPVMEPSTARHYQSG